MKAAPKVKTSERAGRWLGRFWRGVAHRESRAIRWLAAQGVPVRTGRLLFWVVKLVFFGVLLYVAFWVALLLLFGVVAAWLARGADWSDEQETEWRNGMSGFGLYRGDVRIDIGDPHEDD
jgi:hypothetical protein